MCSDFGLTINNPKTKHMVTGRQVMDSDRNQSLLLEKRYALWMSFHTSSP